MMAQIEPEVHSLSFTQLRFVSDFPGEQIQCSLEEFAELCVQEYEHAFGVLTDHDKRQKAKAKTLPAILPGRLKADAADTKTESLETWTVLMVESDNGTVSLGTAAKALQSLIGLVKTSTSHTPESPRWHALLPYSRPMNLEEHTKYKRLAFQYYEERLSLSKESKNLRQVFFYGHLQGTHPVETSILEGEQYIDQLLDLVEMAGVLKSPKKAKAAAAKTRRGDPDYDWTFKAKARKAKRLLDSIDPSCSRPIWVEALLAAKECGVPYEDALEWSRGGGEKFAGDWDVERTWNSIKEPGDSDGPRVGMPKLEELAKQYPRYSEPDDEPARSAVHPWAVTERHRPKATEFVVDSVISAGLTVIAGANGVGKTTALVPLFMLVAWLCKDDHPVRPELRRHVVYVAEDTDQVAQVVESVILASDDHLTWEKVEKWFHIVDARRYPLKTLTSHVEDLSRYSYINEYGFTVQPVIVLDTKAAVVSIGDENSNAEQADLFIAIREAFYKAHRIPVVVVLHMPKAASRSDVEKATFRGADAQGGEATQLTYLLKDDKNDNLRSLAIVGGTTKKRFTAAEEVSGLLFTGVFQTTTLEAEWKKEPQTVGLRHNDIEYETGVQRVQRQSEADEEQAEEQLLALLRFIVDHPLEFSLTQITQMKDITGATGTRKRASHLTILETRKFIVGVKTSSNGGRPKMLIKATPDGENEVEENEE